MIYGVQKEILRRAQSPTRKFTHFPRNRQRSESDLSEESEESGGVRAIRVIRAFQTSRNHQSHQSYQSHQSFSDFSELSELSESSELSRLLGIIRGIRVISLRFWRRAWWITLIALITLIKSSLLFQNLFPGPIHFFFYTSLFQENSLSSFYDAIEHIIKLVAEGKSYIAECFRRTLPQSD